MVSPRRVYCHIGLHKTGTTYLQGVLRRNREELARQGVQVPGGDGELEQNLAVWDLVGRRPRGAPDTRIAGQWDALLRAVRQSDHDAALISVEYLSLATSAQVRTAVADLGGDAVRVIVTVRDLGRVLVSEWQEAIKNDKTWTWEEYIAALRDPDLRGRSPARGFWQRQDIPAILDVWRTAIPVERITVIVVPPPGVESTLLERFAGAVGFDPAGLAEPARTNESVSAAGAEVIRQLNERLGHRLNQRQYNYAVRSCLPPRLRPSNGERLVVPPDSFGWVTAEAHRMASALEAAGYRVVGDPAELTPQPAVGRNPGDVTTDELFDAAMDALTGLAEQHAAAWWSSKRPEEGVDTDAGARLRSAARSAGFRWRRRAADLADRNRGAARAAGLYLRLQSEARRRAAHRRT